MRSSIWPLHAMSLAELRAHVDGRVMPISRAIMAITTSSSISGNAGRRRDESG